MLDNTQIEELKEHLNKAQNPVFYFDNDADGLCSSLILRRYIGRGKGVAVRSYPDLNASYAKKAQELKADYVFVLDKPVISKEFVEELDKIGLPLVWIDHHNVSGDDLSSFQNLFVYNPAKNIGNESAEPTTYIAYSVTKRKEDLWLAMTGCISDHYLPDFKDEFEKLYPEFWNKEIRKPFDALYKTEIGKIAVSFNFGLKDSTTHVIQFQNYLLSCKGPGEVFSEVLANKNFRAKYSDIKKKYDSLLNKALKSKGKKLIFFEYSGDLSISSDLANEISYRNPGKLVVVAFKKGGVANISLRGVEAKKIFSNLLSKLNSASGGGHDEAVGARIRVDELEKFKELIESELK